MAYVLIFVLVYLIGRVIGIFMHLVPQPEKLEDRKYQIGAGVIAVVITLGHPDGLDCPLNGSYGFHPK